MLKLNYRDTVLFIGDSLTHGGRGNCMDCNHILGHGYQELVCAQLAYDNLENMPRFVNKGISGQTMVQIAARWDEDVLKYKPAVVSLLAGVNDISRCLDEDTGTFTAKYINAAEEAVSKTFNVLPDVKFFLCEPFYLDAKNQTDKYAFIPHPICEPDFTFGNANCTDETVKKYNEKLDAICAALKETAEKHGAIFVPFRDLFADATKKVHPSYLVWDNVHPTVVGHKLMADRWLEIAAKYM